MDGDVVVMYFSSKGHVCVTNSYTAGNGYPMVQFRFSASRVVYLAANTGIEIHNFEDVPCKDTMLAVTLVDASSFVVDCKLTD